MWTAVARSIRAKHPEKKIILAQRPRWRERLRGRRYGAIQHSEIFLNNPDFATPEEIERGTALYVIYADDPRNSYAAEVTDERIVFRTGGHVIDILCREHGVLPGRRKCVLTFTDRENEAVDRLAAQFGDFIAIEPHTKDEFTPNKGWSWDSWQAVADRLKTEHKLVQVGAGGQRILDGVEDVSGQISFRETAALIARSRLFMGTEGGLMHAANAVDARAVIIFSGYIPVELTGYDGHHKLCAPVDCAPCGLRTPCPYGLKCTTTIEPEYVVATVLDALGAVPAMRS